MRGVELNEWTTPDGVLGVTIIFYIHSRL